MLNLVISPLFRNPKRTHSFCYENVLGTTFELKAFGSSKDAQRACDLALAEIDRLESVYSRYKPNSELNRFLLTPVGDAFKVSDDLALLLQVSLNWVKQSKGAFHPGVDAYVSLWKQAEKLGKLPELAITEHFQDDFCKLEGNLATRLFPFSLNFNAIAKGLIVDKALQAAKICSPQISINLGGDLSHSGYTPINVYLEERAVDNLQGQGITICNQAVASSGSSRRGFTVANKHYSHILNPTTGWPIQHTITASVIAPDCITADVLATAFSVLEPKESLMMANDLNVGCLLTDEYQQHYQNAFFSNHLVKG